VDAKGPKNLLLDDEALRRGEEYCEKHGTTLSRLVEDFLMALPPRRSEPERATRPIRRSWSARR
jgi:hypothetical protein